MATVTTPARSTGALRAAVASRAVVAAVLAVVVTFTAASSPHTPQFGLGVLGGFQILQGLVVALGAPAVVPSRSGRALQVVRGLIGVALGVAGLALIGGGMGVLLLLTTVGWLVPGALEVMGGLRRADRGACSREAVTVGGLSVLVGVVLTVIAPDDSVFLIGLVGAWAAVVAVYLGIAAASVARPEPRA